MGGGDEKRQHRRLAVKTGIFCKKVGLLHDHIFSGNTIDISPDGVLAAFNEDIVIEAGDLFNIELDMPDISGSERFDGKISAYGRAVRIADLQAEQNTGKKNIAFQFCTRPQIDI